VLPEIVPGTRLDSVDIWPSSAVKRLASVWVVTAEQVVAVAATQGGVDALAMQTELPRLEVKRLIEATRERLPLDIRERLRTPVDTSLYGLGGLRPPVDQKK
jgi:hypothetical protein